MKNKILWFFLPTFFQKGIRRFLYVKAGQKHINEQFVKMKFTTDWGMILFWYLLKLDNGQWTTKIENFKSFYWFLFWLSFKIKILYQKIIFKIKILTKG